MYKNSKEGNKMMRTHSSQFGEIYRQLIRFTGNLIKLQPAEKISHLPVKSFIYGPSTVTNWIAKSKPPRFNSNVKRKDEAPNFQFNGSS